MCACQLVQRPTDDSTRIGSILIADDEEMFRESTCRLLKREGYVCRTAKDAEEALDCLRRDRYDVMLADIRMPRNPDLRVVREARQLDRQLPIILVTGYPSMDTAIRSVEMSVAAYLTKPVDFDELRRKVRDAVAYSQNQRSLAAARRRLESCLADLDATGARNFARDHGTDAPVSLPTIRTLASCLSELLLLLDRTGSGEVTDNLCELLDCPQQPDHLHAIRDAIEVLKKTKSTFKSKALAQLRVRLERALVGKKGPESGS